MDSLGESEAVDRGVMACDLKRMGYSMVPETIAGAVDDAVIKQLTLVLLYSKVCMLRGYICMGMTCCRVYVFVL